MAKTHTYDTTLTFAASEDLEADFHVVDMSITYIMDWHDKVPHITKIVIADEEVTAQFMFNKLADDPFLLSELLEYAERDKA